MALPAFQASTASDMRRCMGRFSTGVAVVSAGDDEHGSVASAAEGSSPSGNGAGPGYCGMTISSLTSISLDPAILMISLTVGSRTTDMVAQTGRFAVSILSSRQEAVARHFATRGGSRFEGFECDRGDVYGLPLIKDALVQAECHIHSWHDVGDHRVFFGEVDSLRYRDGTGLVFYSGRFGDFRDFGHDEMPWWF